MYTPRTYNPNVRGLDACRGAQTLDQNTKQIYKSELLEICSEQNFRATARDNTLQNTDKGHIPSPRVEIKIRGTAGNRTRGSGLEGRDSTDYASATDLFRSQGG